MLHVGTSVGSFGGVVSFLLLALLAWRGPSFAASAYVAMQPIAELVILPLCLAALITGVIQSLWTAWGLTRHYWVLATSCSR